MASTLVSSIQNSFKYDVFLSFRGEDTRKNFVDHLYHALENKGIYTYKDDEKIKQGNMISDELIKAIEDSKFYIIIFSKSYASSSWCLEELVKIMECRKGFGHTAYPVFYDVEPTEVRKQSGSVGDAFAKHKEDEAAGKWREALKEASDLAGWELKSIANGHEAKFIQKIVQEISLELRSINFGLDEKLVGMETRVKDVVSSLETSVDDVRMLGIWGMGGAGKTTLARAVFDHISIQFDGESFIENVREVSKASSEGLKKLQKQVLSDGLKDQNIEVSSVFGGKSMMQRRMRGRKVLVVLDDVDHKDQLEALAGDCNWFEPGSRIIITTRDEQVLVAHRVSLIQNVTLLSQAEAGCLFSRYAFGREIPTQRYEELSGQVVQYAHGLPLTIKVLGSFLCGQSEPYWVDAIERLKKIPLKATMERLEISFDGLEDDYKEIFLDVACILKGWEKVKAIRALESRGFHAEVGLRVLVQKSLITYTDYGSMWMHDHLEEMGRNIVRRSRPDEPQRHSRLWVDEEIQYILTNDMGTQATKCLYFMSPGFSAEIALKGLAKMKNLRFVYMNLYKYYYTESNIVEFDKVSEYLPSSLRFMRWSGFPFSSLPNTFQGKYLVELEIEWSNIVQLWEDGEEKVLHKLRFLKITKSKLRTFDLRLAPNLEQLTISRCDDFVELHIPADNHSKLEYLSLTYSKLKNLHLENTPNLVTLKLDGCNDLVELQMPVENLKLEKLYLGHSKLRTLDLGLTPNLKRLNLKNCYDLVEINAPIGCLKKLVFLDLSGCGRFKSFVFYKWYQPAEAGSLSELHLIAEPTDVCPLHSDNDYPKFRFECYYKEDPLSSFGNLERLISMGLCVCTNLESFSRSICSLQCIRKLTLEGIITETLRWYGFPFSSLPNTFQGKYLVQLELKESDIVQLWEDGEGKVLNNLRFLKIRSPKFRTFDLRLAPNLEQLTISCCYDFVELYIPADNHLKLEYLSVTDSKLKNLYLGSTPNLETLILKGCNDLVELQMPAESTKLKEIDLSHLKLTTLHLGNTLNLKTLILRSCNDLVELQLPAESPKLEQVDLSHSKLKNLHLRNTPNLENLTLEGCNDLVELQMPAESTKLKYLNLAHSKLRTLHLGNTLNLEKLKLKGCNDLVELQMPVESLKLERLELRHSKLRTLDLGLTPNLRRLNLKNCYDLVEINAPIGCLKKLFFLDLSGCGRFKSFVFEKWSQRAKADSLSELHLIAEPTDVCPLHSDDDYPKFRSECYYKEDRFSSFGNLERLISLGLCACTNLESFSRSICGLQCLTKLTLEGRITEAPRDLDQLECLEELTFSSTEIKHLPDSICKLKHLKSLELKSCFLLQKLPDDLGQIESLETLIITDCNRLRDIPNNMGKIKCRISPKVYKRYTHGRYKQKR